LAMANRGPNTNNSQVDSWFIHLYSLCSVYAVLCFCTLFFDFCTDVEFFPRSLTFGSIVLHYNSEDSMARF
jgi:cyclophilin family peptidyl-prolyl cis-trans isomerase